MGTPAQKQAANRFYNAQAEQGLAEAERANNLRDRTTAAWDHMAGVPSAAPAPRGGGMPRTFDPSGAGGGGQSFSLGYAPRPQSGVNAHVKSPFETTPQDNFEAAKAKGELTPQKITQAGAYGAAHGQTFDPATGYKPMDQTQSEMPGKPAVPPKPVANDGFVKGLSGPVTTGSLDPVTGKMKVTTLPARAAGGPVSADQPYLVGENGPEIVVPKTAGTVIPNHVFAPTIRTAPDAGRIATPAVSTPTTPQMAFPSSMPDAAPMPGPGTFAPSFESQHLSPPAGVRRTDFRRFNASPQGVAFAVENQVHNADADKRIAAQQAFHTGMYERQKNDAKAEREAQDRKDADSIDSLIHSMSSNETTLDPVWRDIVKSAKGAKGKQAALDLAIRHAMDKDAEKRRSEREGGKAVTGSEFITDGSGQFGVPVVVHKDGSRSPIGGALPLGKTAPATAPKTAKGSDGRTYQWHPEQGWTPLGGEKTVQQQLHPHTTKDGELQWYDRQTGKRVYPEGAPANVPTAGDTAIPTSANNRYFPNYKPIK